MFLFCWLVLSGSELIFVFENKNFCVLIGSDVIVFCNNDNDIGFNGDIEFFIWVFFNMVFIDFWGFFLIDVGFFGIGGFGWDGDDLFCFNDILLFFDVCFVEFVCCMLVFSFLMLKVFEGVMIFVVLLCICVCFILFEFLLDVFNEVNFCNKK